MTTQPQRLVAALDLGSTKVVAVIAEVTGEALGTIHTRARLGLQKLREELERNEFEG